MPPRKRAAALVADSASTNTRSSRSKTKAAEAMRAAAEPESQSKVANNATEAKATTTGSGGAGGHSSGTRGSTKTVSTRASKNNASAATGTTAAKAAKGAKAAAPSAAKKEPAAKKGKAQKRKEAEKEAVASKPPPKTGKKQTRATKAAPAPSSPATASAPVSRAAAAQATTPPTEGSVEPEKESSPVRAQPAATPPVESISTKDTTTLSIAQPTNMRKRTRDAVEVDKVNGGKEIDAKRKKAKTLSATATTPTAQPKKRGGVGAGKRNAPFSMEVCEAWFSNYEDEMDENVMSPTMANKWLEDLGISPEGATYYIIAWKMEAKSMLKLTKGEFVTGMTKLGVDSNEKLLDVLPSILEQTAPSPDAPEFRAFYKFIFNYSKSDSKPGAKNVELDVAVEFLNMVLDRDRYRIDYATRSQDDEMEIPGGRKADGAFPHVLTFIEFLKKVRPVKVINRDQWESFLPFNKSVGWELEGYSENGAWPSLFDQYVDWRKSTYLETVSPEQQGESTSERTDGQV